MPSLAATPQMIRRAAIARHVNATDSFALATFVLLLLASALEAYSVAGIPITWLGNVAVLSSIVLVKLAGTGDTGSLWNTPGMKIMFCLLAWAVAVTGWNCLADDYSDMLPRLASASYPSFVGLRFFSVALFMGVLLLVHMLVERGHRDAVLRWIANVGLIVAAISIYVYFAQILGLWEPPRTRTGTDGGEQAVQFSYAFHRAMGTFREPSHLAEWLILPLAASFMRFRTPFNLHGVCISSALLLTGSLTGIVGAAIGLAGAILVTNPFGRHAFKVLGAASVAALLGYFVFNGSVQENDGGRDGVLEVVADRLGEIQDGGIEASNRGYIYEYVDSVEAPFWGAGLGNSNLALSAAINSPSVVSFLSLYLNVWFSLGYIGLALLILLLAMPVVGAVRLRGRQKQPEIIWLVSIYIAWLVIFAVHTEELSPMFAVGYVLLADRVRECKGVA